MFLVDAEKSNLLTFPNPILYQILVMLHLPLDCLYILLVGHLGHLGHLSSYAWVYSFSPIRLYDTDLHFVLVVLRCYSF